MAEQTNVPVKSGGNEIRRRGPFDPFESLSEEFMRLWDQAWPFGAGRLARPWRRLAPSPETWLPSTDIFEKGGSLVVKTELPGVKKEDVDVKLEGADLIIQGKRESESEVREEDYYRMERSSGSFYRRVPLPFESQAQQIEASFSNGVLEVRIPKPVETKPPAQRIPIS
ncbi:MAG: Hsp20/alpha crystallin family protein [Chloroflexi bacterium]|nr:Hsp20/alpha crystallin family protein [Chloroflexota bacterium]